MEKNVEINKLYEYYIDDESKVGTVTEISDPIRNRVYVKLDNGDQMEMTAFKRIAEEMDDFDIGNDNDHTEPLDDIDRYFDSSNESRNDGAGDGNIPRIQLDEDGIPIMQLEDGTVTGKPSNGSTNRPKKNRIPPDVINLDGMDVVVDPSEYGIPSNKNGSIQMVTPKESVTDPVVALFNKSNKESVKIMVELSVDMIPKGLFDVINTSFGEDSVETVFNKILESLDKDKSRESILSEIKKYYDTEEPKKD